MVAVAASALIDELLPRFDEVERHARLVRAAPPAVYAALWRADLLASPLVRGLLMLRGIPAALRHPRRPARRRTLTLAQVLESYGFVLLGERPEREVVLGVVGRFWTLTGERLALDAPGFVAFDRPGYAKAVWDFRLAPEGDATRLSTETRILGLDAESRRRFRRYWRVIGPFSGLTRRAFLRAVDREATR
jgi:hypothetical protein